MSVFYRHAQRAVFAASVLALWTLSALAQTPAAPAAPAAAAAANAINSGDTAWMLTSTALVLMMTIPGLALFYGGMVRKMNVLATVMQSFAITCLVTVLWMIVGYSLAFTEGNPFFGGFSRVLLDGMTVESINDLAKTIPESVYMCFQMTFAIITPALICGAFADRMKFSALLWFIGLWAVLVYAPIAHWVWGPGGFLNDSGILDFAGGTVVHVNSGVAGLMAITPASGFVDPRGALIIGIAAGILCYWGVTGLKNTLGYDDSLDAFGVHGIGGATGAILTGVLAVSAVGGEGHSGLIDGNAH